MPTNGYVFKISLSMLKLIGEYMQRTSKILTAFRTINIIIMLVLLIFVIGPVFQDGHKKIVKIVEAVLSVVHPLLKYMLLIHNKPYVEELLANDHGGFWHDDIAFDENFIAHERRFLRLIRAIQLILPVSSISAVLFFMLRPAFHKNRLFLVETWVIDSLELNTLVLAFQYYLFLLMVPLIMGYDSLYLALCVHVTVQMRRLKYKLASLPVDGTSHRRLIYCIKHHQFLIQSFLKMKNMFSFTLLFHYFVTLTSCCIELYELMENAEYDIEQVLNIFVLFCQFGYYAFPAGQIASEFNELSTSLYVSEWYKNTPAFQKLVLFVIARSQRREQFYGGGVIPMDMDTFGSVIRRSFSFYAVLRNVLNK